MRIAILGAGFPGLLVAHGLAERGHEVSVLGKPEKAGVLSGAGPRHLWDCEALKIALPEVDRTKIHVRWLLEDGKLAKNSSPEAREQYPGYWVKSRGKSTGKPPCRGVNSFDVVDDGFRRLAQHYDLGRFEPDPSLAHRAKLKKGEWTLSGLVNDIGTYERVVTTLPPNLSYEIFGVRKDPPRIGMVRFYWSDSLAGYGANVAENDLLYSGDETVWWHRVSHTHRGWCFESRPGRGPDPGYWTGDYADMLTQLSALDEDLEYPAGVIPVGRFAEWDGEMMVNDVLEGLDRYCERVEASVTKTRIFA